MGQIKVSTDKLESASSEMKTVKNEVDGIRGNLASTAGSVTSGWRGSSEGSFNNMWRRWHNAMKHLTEAIETTSGQLKNASNVYEETDRKAVQVK